MTVKEGQILWEPSEKIKQEANITQYINWLNKEKNLSLKRYNDLWKWSVSNIDGYWESIWEYFEVISSNPYKQIRTGETIMETKWFSGATLNYVENIFKHTKQDKIAIYSKSEHLPLSTTSWQDLVDQVTSVSIYLRKLGVQPGDRVVGYLPNIKETIVVFLATAAIGAVWSACPPEFGVSSTLSRFQQINPKVMFTVDGYQYNGEPYTKMDDVQTIISEIPSIENVIVIPYLNKEPDTNILSNVSKWADVLKEKGDLHFEQVPFDHPLWILYSSGTTGLPKAIVHSHGGILLTNLSAHVLQQDIKHDDRFFWYTTTGWMLWNSVVGALNAGASIVLYDGSPTYPDETILWRLIERTKMTHFGTSPSFILDSIKKGIEPKKKFDLSSLRSFAYTGAPLSPEGFKWVYDNVKSNVRLVASSGGTDICGAIVSSSAILPVYAGEIPCRSLGTSVYSYDSGGEPIYNEVGEMVMTKPLPSMPIFFWADPGNKRYKDSYYNVYPNIWRHGDLLKITDRRTAVIYGRSDATINRGGVRSGTSEIYRVVEAMPEVIDSLVIDLSGYKRKSLLLLFITLRENESLSASLINKINNNIRVEVSPRHTPDEIEVVPSIPMTITGKKMEIPIREVLLGKPVSEVINIDAMRNPESVDYFSNLVEGMKNKLKQK